jgi:hypothetical protein
MDSAIPAFLNRSSNLLTPLPGLHLLYDSVLILPGRRFGRPQRSVPLILSCFTFKSMRITGQKIEEREKTLNRALRSCSGRLWCHRIACPSIAGPFSADSFVQCDAAPSRIINVLRRHTFSCNHLYVYSCILSHSSFCAYRSRYPIPNRKNGNCEHGLLSSVRNCLENAFLQPARLYRCTRRPTAS